MNVIDTSGMSRQDWLKLRTKSIGASDSPVIAGLSKYKSRLALYLEKTGQIEPEEAGEEAWWGTQLENSIATRLNLNDDFGGIQRLQVMARDPRYDWLTATIDLIEEGPSEPIWELKAAGIATAGKLEDGNASTLPPTWVIQAHHQMFVTGRDVCHFAVFAGHRLKLLTFEVPFDLELWEPVLQLNREFWSHVERREPPTDFDPEDAELLTRYFRRVEPIGIISSDPNDIDNAEMFVRAKTEKKHCEQRELIAKAALLFRMGEAEVAQIGDHRFTRKLVEVKANPAPKPRAASSCIRFTHTNGDDE